MCVEDTKEMRERKGKEKEGRMLEETNRREERKVEGRNAEKTVRKEVK